MQTLSYRVFDWLQMLIVRWKFSNIRVHRDQMVDALNIRIFVAISWNK